MIINQKRRIIELVENYKNLKEHTFEKHNCIERSTFTVVAIDSGVPLSQIDRIISLMKGFKILSTYSVTQNWAGYTFDEEQYKKFKEGI